MICIARTLGAPDTVPAGKQDTSASSRSASLASRPSQIDVRYITCEKGAVDREGIGVDVRLEPLRQHDLIDVAGGNVLLGFPDVLLELFARLVGGDLQLVGLLPTRQRQVALELALQKLNFRAGELIER